MNWRQIIVHLAWLAAVAVVIETGAIWACSDWCWTPIQRHYLPACIWSSLPVITPATAEARIIWKTGPHRKRQIATDEDVADSEGGTGMQLSQSALDAGWKRLVVGPPEQFSTATLRLDLPDLAFDGEGIWSFLLLPEAGGLAVCCYGLYGCIRLANRLPDWAVEHSLRHQRSWRDEPSWSLLDWCAETVQNLYSYAVVLHRRAQHRVERHHAETNHSLAASEPEARQPSFAIPIFGVYNGTGDGYLWSEKDEIE